MPVGPTDSMWLRGHISELRQVVHEQVLSEDASVVQALLRDPGASDLLYGFEDNAMSLRVPTDATYKQLYTAGPYDQLLLLTEAIGVRRIRNPEMVANPAPEIGELLEALDAFLGFRVDFPNPYPGEAGLDTGRGILTYRATQALFQAWRVRQLVRNIRSPRILEIGAGSGRTAYYARKLGLNDYTIVDLPLTCVASANFLGRTLGPEHLRLYGEDTGGDLKIIPPAAFFQSANRFDLAINADSITEMSRETAEAYFRDVNTRARLFLSINHEGNPFRARDLFEHHNHSRSPYLMRPGYVEEVVNTSAFSSRFGLRRAVSALRRLTAAARP